MKTKLVPYKYPRLVAFCDDLPRTGNQVKLTAKHCAQAKPRILKGECKLELNVSFKSDGLTLAGVVHTPDDMAPGESRPAFLVLHGFGPAKTGLRRKSSRTCFATGVCRDAL